MDIHEYKHNINMSIFEYFSYTCPSNTSSFLNTWPPRHTVNGSGNRNSTLWLIRLYTPKIPIPVLGHVFSSFLAIIFFSETGNIVTYIYYNIIMKYYYLSLLLYLVIILHYIYQKTLDLPVRTSILVFRWDLEVYKWHSKRHSV